MSLERNRWKFFVREKLYVWMKHIFLFVTADPAVSCSRCTRIFVGIESIDPWKYGVKTYLDKSNTLSKLIDPLRLDTFGLLCHP